MPVDSTIEPKRRDSYQAKAAKAKSKKAKKKKWPLGGHICEDLIDEESSIDEQSDEDNEEPKETEGRVKGLRFTRTQVPLQPALWRTTHSIQGVSADFAAVKPPDKGFARALLYVQLSRCTSAEALYLLRRLKRTDFTANKEDVKLVMREYERLQKLPNRPSHKVRDKLFRKK